MIIRATEGEIMAVNEGEEVIDITINGWASYNPRRDVKYSSWFKMSHEWIFDPDFYSWHIEERLAWIYLLSVASKRNNGCLKVNFEHARRTANLTKPKMCSAIEKLNDLGIITYTSRTRHAPVTHTCATDRQTDQPTNQQAAQSLRDLETSIEEVFKVYPKRQGQHRKKLGIERILKQLKASKDPISLGESIKRAATNYAAHCRLTEKEGTPFVMQFATWSSNWEEWVDYKPKRSDTRTVVKL